MSKITETPAYRRAVELTNRGQDPTQPTDYYVGQLEFVLRHLVETIDEVEA